MMKRAFEGTEFAGLDEYLEGPSALCVSKEDAKLRPEFLQSLLRQQTNLR